MRPTGSGPLRGNTDGRSSRGICTDWGFGIGWADLVGKYKETLILNSVVEVFRVFCRKFVYNKPKACCIYGDFTQTFFEKYFENLTIFHLAIYDTFLGKREIRNPFVPINHTHLNLRD